ncbi:MAG TPA: DUF721 domain-containing protein [Gammaproteobacteria bacterium]|jgi:hypothetical protein
MKSIGSCVPQTLANKAEFLKRLNQAILDCVPTELIAHVEVAGLEGTKLTLTTQSPVWANKLRYLTDEIARRLSAHTGLPISSVKLLVRPVATGTPAAKKRKKPYLSKDSAQQLKALANFTGDSPLKKALTRLATRGGQGK